MWAHEDYDGVQHDTFNDPSAGFIADHEDALERIGRNAL
jgi:hypothetical protein